MKDKLLSYLKKSPNDTWQLGGYYLPTKLYSPRSIGSREIDLKNFRDKTLKNISKHEQRVYDLLKPTTETYIPEFPVPIYDHSLWLFLCKSWQADEDEITGKACLWVDFFFPYRQCVIEADGNQHSSDLIQYKTDLIRDNYLKVKYGLRTYRFSKFLDDWNAGLEWMLGETKLANSMLDPQQFEDELMENWFETYSTELHLMKLLDKFFPDTKYIKVTQRQLYKLNLGTLIGGDMVWFNRFFKLLYGKIVEIIPSKP